MGGMKTSLIIIISLALIACLIVLGSRPDEPDQPDPPDPPDPPVEAGVPETSRGPSFEVRVVMPRLHLPLFGILPESFEAQLDGLPRELGFDHASPGAAIGSVGHDRLELSAEGGWDLSIETDDEGRIAPGTRLVFPLTSWQATLRCRPAYRDVGYLRTTTRAGSDELDGRFLVKVADCENVKSGEALGWPAAPLTVQGSFEGLSRLAG